MGRVYAMHAWMLGLGLGSHGLGLGLGLDT